MPENQMSDIPRNELSENQIQFNVKVHNEISKKYERLHRAMFNPIEQERLHNALSLAVKAVKTNSKPLVALDFGCGSGNLTKHLIDLGIKTISADVSQAFLNQIEQRFSNTSLCEILKLNGKDLSNIQNEQLDTVSMYSVLHHVPDYLHIIKEICRVLKPGGVIYIDHEAIEPYYDRPKEYVEFLRKAKPKLDIRRYLRLLLDVRGYHHIIRRILNPRYKREGDIHVWPDDHIEWDKIKELLASEGFEIILENVYLLYKSSYKLDVYNQYKGKCADQRVLAARK